MTLETEQDRQPMRIIGSIVAKVLKAMMLWTEPGMTTAGLNQKGKPMLLTAV